jgi:hypothetical protein
MLADTGTLLQQARAFSMAGRESLIKLMCSARECTLRGQTLPHSRTVIILEIRADCMAEYITRACSMLPQPTALFRRFRSSRPRSPGS